MKKRSTIALISAMAFCVMAFTGCGSEETGTGTADSNTTPVTTVEATTTEPETTTTTPADATPEPETTTAAVEESIAEPEETTNSEEQVDDSPELMAVMDCLQRLAAEYTDAEAVTLVCLPEENALVCITADRLIFKLRDDGNGIILKYGHKELTKYSDYSIASGPVETSDGYFEYEVHYECSE